MPPLRHRHSPGHLSAAALLLVLVALLVVLGVRSAAAVPPPRADDDPWWFVPAPAREGAWPLAPEPAVERGFDPPTSPWGPGHRGVDLLGHAGQGVRASKAGRISFVGMIAGKGVVVVDHGSVRTTYEPVEASVERGEHVGRGQRIGTLRRAHSHCFPRACLHWGLRRGETYLDPLTLVGGGPVRLLPWSGSLVAAAAV